LARTIAQPVVDSLLVVQMKKDPLRGSEDLQAMCRMFTILGTMFFNICGAYLIQLTEEADTFFYLPLGTGVVFAIASFVYPKPSEGFIHTRSLKGKANTY